MPRFGLILSYGSLLNLDRSALGVLPERDLDPFDVEQLLQGILVRGGHGGKLPLDPVIVRNLLGPATPAAATAIGLDGRRVLKPVKSCPGLLAVHEGDDGTLPQVDLLNGH